jgi:DNA-binding IclR family transcriptional regulator
VRGTETAQVDEANAMGRSPVVFIHGASTATSAARPQQGLSVATKLLRILGAFSVDRPRLRASDVHRRSGLPFATVYRLLNELVSHGILEHQPDGTYTVGIRLWEVAAVNPELRSLRRWALPRMYELCSSFRYSVYLDVPVGIEALCLEELSAVDDDTRRHGPGSRFPLDSTTGGHVLLFHAGPEVAETYLAAPSAARGSADRLRQALAYIGRTGVAVDASDRISVAAPVFDQGGAIAAALDVVASGPAHPRRLVGAVRSAGAELSDAIARYGTRPRGQLDRQGIRPAPPIPVSGGAVGWQQVGDLGHPFR